MRISKTAIAVSVLSLFAAAMVPATSMAAGGASGAAVKYAKQGQIGEVITNPYKIAPLTAIIRSGGYALSDVSVRIVPKPNGSEIKYDVDRSEVLTHGGIPVFGLYPDYVRPKVRALFGTTLRAVRSNGASTRRTPLLTRPAPYAGT